MISVITPTHDMKYLEDAYFSLLEQTYTEWEWIVVPNGKVWDAEVPFKDPRVKVFRVADDVGSVGALKHFACVHVTGELTLELDHDDLLLPTALEELERAAAEHPDVDFFYSNCAPTFMANMRPYRYGNGYGWQYRPLNFQGFELAEAIAPEPLPQNLSRIWYAPDHFRAWRTKTYRKIGGHDPKLAVADDHDLVCRFYLQGKMLHIDKGLYIYRVHADNTWQQRNAQVQVAMWANHNRYILPMMEKWSKKQGLRLIDLCGGIAKPEGYTSIDMEGGDISADLNGQWPVGDNSVGVLRAMDALEHLVDPIHTMNEAYRVLAHGGLLHVQVPSTSGKAAFRDPTHVSFWNDESFWYYTNRAFSRYLGKKYQGRFQILKLEERMDAGIVYVHADLLAIKSDELRFHGELLI